MVKPRFTLEELSVISGLFHLFVNNMLSRFLHHIQILPDTFAVFNSLVMQVIFVDDIELQRILACDSSLPDSSLLFQYGIWVNDTASDECVLNALKTLIHEQSRKLHLLYLDLSNCCNLSCPYCFINNNVHSDDNNPNTKLMSKEIALIAIDKFLSAAEDNIDVAQVTLFGGEPLLNWDVLIESVNHIRAIAPKLKVTLVTNATLLDKNKISFLKKHHVGIGVSMDGPKQINDQFRFFTNSEKSVYDLVSEKIALLNTMNSEYSVSATITESLLQNQECVISWLKGLSIHNIFWNLFHYSNTDDSWQLFYTTMTEFIEKCHEELVNNSIIDEKVQEQINLFLNHEFKIHSCGAVGLNQITVNPNGNICICQGDMRASSKIIGNIENDAIEMVLQKEAVKWWTEIYTIDRPECQDCPALFVCGGGCPLQAEALFGKRSEIDFATCIYSKWFLKWLLKQYYLSGVEN